MKQKTSKLQKLERNRFSILTDAIETCFACGNIATDTHEIYSGANRQVSMQNGFCVPLCRTCHNNITINNGANAILKRICQAKYEETHTREQFLELIGKNYLD